KHLTPFVDSYPHHLPYFMLQPSLSASVCVCLSVSGSASLPLSQNHQDPRTRALRRSVSHRERDLYFMGLNRRDLDRILALLQLFHQWPILSLSVSAPTSSLF
ncbi:hypothetical protein F2P56_024500, partial [Juglans regia]